VLDARELAYPTFVAAATEAGVAHASRAPVGLVENRLDEAERFFHLTSGSGVLFDGGLRTHLADAGFGSPRRTGIRPIPDYRLYTATAI
jgi:hypothetical protein